MGGRGSDRRGGMHASCNAGDDTLFDKELETLSGRKTKPR